MTRSKVGTIFTKFTLLIIAVVVFIILAVMLPGTFPQASNIATFFRQGSVYGVVVMGVTWVLAMDEMDVAFPEIAAFSSVLCAVLMAHGVPLDLAVLITLVFGGLFGWVNGFFVANLGLPSMITTIAIAGVAKSTGMWLAQGRTIAITKETTAVFYNIMWGQVAGVPAIFLAFAAIVIVMALVQERTKFGQYVYAIGDNKEAALAAGIKVKHIQRTVFTLSGIFGSFGGILVMLMVNSGQPTIGSTLFLDSFTKILLGALFIKVGKTNVVGTFVGVIFLAMLVNGLTQMGIASYISQIITGILLIIGVSLTHIIKRQYEKNAQRL